MGDRHSLLLLGELQVQDTEEEIWGAVSGVWRRRRPRRAARCEVSNGSTRSRPGAIMMMSMHGVSSITAATHEAGGGGEREEW